MTIYLETGRLTLRRFTEADVDNLFELNSDPEAARRSARARPGIIRRGEPSDARDTFGVAVHRCELEEVRPINAMTGRGSLPRMV
jgi:RimJ/RimL family protein N-acetyltransferase